MTEDTCSDPHCGAVHHTGRHWSTLPASGPPEPKEIPPVNPNRIPLGAWVDAVDHARHSPYAASGPVVVVILTGDPAPRVATDLARDVRTMVRRAGWPILADLVGTGTYVDAVEYADAVVVELPGRHEYADLVGRLVAIGHVHGQATVGLVGIPDPWRYGGRHVGTLVHCADPGAPRPAELPARPAPWSPWPAYRGHVNAERAPELDRRADR